MRLAAIVALFILVIAGVVAASWALFQWLFNTVVAGIFGGPSITYWQAAACSMLLGLIASAFRRAGTRE